MGNKLQTNQERPSIRAFISEFKSKECGLTLLLKTDTLKPKQAYLKNSQCNFLDSKYLLEFSLKIANKALSTSMSEVDIHFFDFSTSLFKTKFAVYKRFNPLQYFHSSLNNYPKALRSVNLGTNIAFYLHIYPDDFEDIESIHDTNSDMKSLNSKMLSNSFDKVSRATTMKTTKFFAKKRELAATDKIARKTNDIDESSMEDLSTDRKKNVKVFDPVKLQSAKSLTAEKKAKPSSNFHQFLERNATVLKSKEKKASTAKEIKKTKKLIPYIPSNPVIALTEVKTKEKKKRFIKNIQLDLREITKEEPTRIEKKRSTRKLISFFKRSMKKASFNEAADKNFFRNKMTQKKLDLNKIS